MDQREECECIFDILDIGPNIRNDNKYSSDIFIISSYNYYYGQSEIETV